MLKLEANAVFIGENKGAACDVAAVEVWKRHDSRRKGATPAPAARAPRADPLRKMAPAGFEPARPCGQGIQSPPP